MTKLTLADHIRQDLLKKHDTIANACRSHNLDYERLKKSLTKNVFNPADLDILFPGVSVDELQEKYDFRLARHYKKKSAQDSENAFERKVKSSQLGLLFDLIDNEDVRLIGENQLVAERIAELIKSKCDQIRKALA